MALCVYVCVFERDRRNRGKDTHAHTQIDAYCNLNAFHCVLSKYLLLNLFSSQLKVGKIDPALTIVKASFLQAESYPLHLASTLVIQQEAEQTDWCFNLSSYQCFKCLNSHCLLVLTFALLLT